MPSNTESPAFGPKPSADTEHGDNQRSFSKAPRERGPRRDNPIGALIGIDKDLLKLIARRTRLLGELPKGRNATQAEKELRAAWEKNAGQISRDPKLIRNFFALLQQVECLLSPAAVPGSAFTLSPADKAAAVDIEAPGSSRQARLLAVLAACSGQACVLRHIMLGDALIEGVKTFNQLGCGLRWEENGQISVRGGKVESFASTTGMLVDKAVHVGEDSLNFYLMLMSMAVRPCRLKIMGESALRLADFSPLRHFLPLIGARFTSIVPGQEGLPARLEASGILPESLIVPEGLPYDAALALCVALATAPAPVRVDLSAYPYKAALNAELESLFTTAGLALTHEGDCLCFAGSIGTMKAEPAVGMDLLLAATLLALPALCGGTVSLRGNWPRSAESSQLVQLLEHFGLAVKAEEQAIHSQSGGSAEIAFDATGLSAAFMPLYLCLASREAGLNGQATLPDVLEHPAFDPETLDHFLAQLGLERDGLTVRKAAVETGPFVSPSAAWGMALALGAYIRPHVQMINPGIVSHHMPNFWQLYNSLPRPLLGTAPRHQAPPPPENGKRRIRAGVFLTGDQLPPAVQDNQDTDE